MGWETRRGKGRYYTRSRRQDGRVVREYFGTGDAAETVAALDALEREWRQEQDAACRAQLETLSAADDVLDDADAHLDAVTRVVLVGSGYHQHKRGEWRKRRNAREEP